MDHHSGHCVALASQRRGGEPVPHVDIDEIKHLMGGYLDGTQCSILLVTRVVFIFITERGKERESSCFGPGVYLCLQFPGFDVLATKCFIIYLREFT